MLRALTIEYVLVSLFVTMCLELVAPSLLAPSVGYALGAVFALLVVRDVALTIHEGNVIDRVINELGEDDDD